MMLCALCLNEGNQRRGKCIAEDVGIALCGQHRARIRWHLEPRAEYTMSAAEELVARQALLRATR